MQRERHKTEILKRSQPGFVFVLSQYDGANIEQRIIGYGWFQNQEAKLKIVGGDI